MCTKKYFRLMNKISDIIEDKNIEKVIVIVYNKENKRLR